MPWAIDRPNAGFTDNQEPWLPIPKKHFLQAVDRQNADPNSLLNTWRRLLHWRKQQPALIAGDFKLWDTVEPLFGFIRKNTEQGLLCLFNLSDEPVKYDLSVHDECIPETNLGFNFQLRQDILELTSYGVFFANLQT